MTALAAPARRTGTLDRAVLSVSGLVIVLIGGASLVAPVWFREVNGIRIEAGASLLSETRAAGALLLATGIGTTVREFCQYAFAHAGLDWEDYVRYNQSYERPTEVQVFARLANFGPEPANADVQLSIDGQVRSIASTSLVPERWTEEQRDKALKQGIAPPGLNVNR